MPLRHPDLEQAAWSRAAPMAANLDKNPVFDKFGPNDQS
jgi:hypothetical protein